jgi:hypothetical protein
VRESDYCLATAGHVAAAHPNYTNAHPHDTDKRAFTDGSTDRFNDRFFSRAESTVKKTLVARILALIVLGLNDMPGWIARRRRARRALVPGR